MGAIHSTKISGNFGLKLNGSVWSNRKSFEKSSPTFEVVHFSWLDRSDRNGPFHLTIPTHSQPPDLAVRCLLCTKWRKILITALLWIVNSRSLGVTRTSMYSYHRSVAASQAKCMFRLLTALKDDSIYLENLECSFRHSIRFLYYLKGRRKKITPDKFIRPAANRHLI